MRSLLQLVGHQEIHNNRVFHLALDYTDHRLSLKVKQHLVQHETNAVEYIYDKLLDLDQDTIRLTDILFNLHRHSYQIADKTRRGRGKYIIAPKYVIDYIGNDTRAFEFIESDLPDQSLIIIGYKSDREEVQNVDSSIIIGSSDNKYYDEVFIRPDYHSFYKVLKIVC